MTAPMAKAANVNAAFAACRSIRFAVKNASRFGGEFSLNDILAADRLAREALGEIASAASAPSTLKNPVLKRTSVKKSSRHAR